MKLRILKKNRNMVGLNEYVENYNKDGWEIDLLPVSESKKSGDCILLRFGNLFQGKDKQRVIIIDGGYAETAQAVKNHLRKYYKCEQDDKLIIDLMVLSHPDNDHISGLVKLVEDEDVVVRELLLNAPWHTMNRTWFKDGRITDNSLERSLKDDFEKLANLIKTAEDKGTEVYYATDFLGTCTFGNAKLHILGPDKEFYNLCIANSEKTRDKAEDVPELIEASLFSSDMEERYVRGQIEWADEDSTTETNESSIIFMFEYDNVKILFTGDAGRCALQRAFQYAKKEGVDISDVTIIKIPHHGSRHNFHPDIFEYFTGEKQTCYISCTKGEEGTHPSKRLVNQLLEMGFKVLMTAGSTLHRGHNAPDRGWKSASSLKPYPTMEKLK